MRHHRIRRWFRRVALVLMGATGIACVSSPAPVGWLPNAAAARSDVYGAWVVVERDSAAPVEGEFLAVDRDTVFVLGLDGTIRRVPTAAAARSTLALYDSQARAVALAAALGTVSTLSHGFVLLLSAPVWMTAGTIAAARQSRAPIVRIARGGTWEPVRRHARFPAGMPPALPPTLPVRPVPQPRPR